MTSFIPSRNSGLRILSDFIPRAGIEYARTRNFDFGVDNRANVSHLSPWIRHRLLTEVEVLRAVLGAHSLDSAEKFVQEVCWRTYWKGWLEMRPQVWTDYAIDALRGRSSLNASETRLYETAVSGSTGIECFDSWSQELVTTGYLHNHARMWFASIWVFTLRLPWSLGADFFMQHLLDGDAASNTLSWRWVAGLQTVGKTYLARSDNIAKYTVGRFAHTPNLAQHAQALPLLEPVQRHSLPVLSRPDTSLLPNTALLVTDDDLTLPDSNALLQTPERALVLDTTCLRSPHGSSPVVRAFVDGALTDFEQRTSATTTRLSANNGGDHLVRKITGWCKAHDIQQLVSACVPVGPTRDALAPLRQMLLDEGVLWRQVRRSWDERAWPLATKGFFNFKRNIPGLIARRMDNDCSS